MTSKLDKLLRSANKLRTSDARSSSTAYAEPGDCNVDTYLRAVLEAETVDPPSPASSSGSSSSQSTARAIGATTEAVVVSRGEDAEADVAEGL